MSGKRINPMEYPPTASSSDEDEETSIGQGDDGNSSTEEEEEEDVAVASSKKPEATEKEQVSDSESGSEEDSESDSEPVRRGPVAKQEPVSAVKSVTKTDDSVVVNEQESKKVKALEKSGSKKRSSETDGGGGDAKKVKRVPGEEEKKSEQTKKNPFHRVWNEEDEIAVLQGYIDYKKVNPNDDQNAFYQSVKKSISFDVSKVQFMEKFRGLKRKFEKNHARGKNGEEPIFTKAHDRKAFGLSKLIWGANGMAPESAVKSNGQAKKSSSKSKKKVESKEEIVSSLLKVVSREEEETTKGKELLKSLARFGVDDLAAQQGWTRLASEDKKRFEEQWEALQVKEFEVYSKRSGFVHEVVTKMAEAFQSNP